ncbi:MAG: hypothetical protein ACOYL6_10400 [Bacteriovoracaceae bacterium]
MFLRDENNLIFISNTLKAIKDQKIACTLWQNVAGKRLVTKGFIFDLNFGAQVLSFKPLAGPFLFSIEHEIYVQSEYKHLLFKSKINFTNQQALMVKVPMGVKAIEARSESRIFLLAEKSSIGVRFFKSKAHGGAMVEYNYRAVDISNGGGSFLITTGSLPKFQPSDKIMLQSIGRDEFKEPIECYIRSISAFQDKRFQNFGHHRVGYQFKNPIDAQKLMTVKSVIEEQTPIK